jgi:murein DD-endopeptidase MepM/ murein hydrolase activator NlpD
MPAEDESYPSWLSPKPRRDGAPYGDLESPFIDEELYAGEDQSDWEPRLAALQSESPFGRFELGQVESIETEAEEEELGAKDQDTQEEYAQEYDDKVAEVDETHGPDPGETEFEAPAVTPDYSLASTFVPANAIRFRRSRTPRTIRRVVIHTLGVPSTARRSGVDAVVLAWKRATRKASSHYLVDRDGKITQMVREQDVAFHTPGANNDSIGIEHADVCNDPAPYTDALYAASAALVRDIAHRNNFVITPQSVAGHDTVAGNHGDPGLYWDWDYYRLLLSQGPDAQYGPWRAVKAVTDLPVPNGWTLRVRPPRPSSHCGKKGSAWGARYWIRRPSAVGGTPADLEFSLPGAGRYTVAFWWPSTSGANSSVTVKVEVPNSSGGVAIVRQIDQSKGGGRWETLPPFLHVSAPTTVRIQIESHGTGRGLILADAVRVLRLGAPEGAGAQFAEESPFVDEGGEPFPSCGRCGRIDESGEEQALYADVEGEEAALPEDATHPGEEPLIPEEGLIDPEWEDEHRSSEQESLDSDQEGPDFESEDEESEAPFAEEVPPPIPVVRQALRVPSGNPIPFAELPPTESSWPISTSRREGRLVSYKAIDGSVVGLRGRMFLADRKGTINGTEVLRWHVGVDLFANKGDVVVACEAGRIVNFHRFLRTNSGQQSWALLVEHSGAVVNYGEVRGDSLEAHGLSKGSSVHAAQPIGFISDTSMLHFETYTKGTRNSHRWLKGEPPPRVLLNPTKYLLFLQEQGAPRQSVTMEATASDDIDIARAVQENRQYGEQLGWREHYDDIVRALGFTDFTPGEELFAKAIAKWQEKQRLGVDGILGPNTWRRMQSAMDLTSGAASGRTSVVSSLAAGRAPSDRHAPPEMPIRLGTLVFRRDGQPVFRYEFKPDDLLWTARLISGEAGARDDLENRAVIAAMLNRFALFTHRVYRTFTSFLRAYSTPLQPVLINKNVARHYLNDPRFRQLGGTYPGTTIPRGQLQHHLDLQETSWERLRPLARTIAVEALMGRMPDTGIGLASEFASTWILYGRRVGPTNRTEAGWLDYTQRFKRDKGWRWIGQQPNLDQKRNAFFVDPRAANLPPDSVQVEALA